MRIAHLTAVYHPNIGGVETHVRSIAESCAGSGDDVTVLTHHAEKKVQEETFNSVRVLRFPQTIRSETYSYSRSMSHYLKAHSADFDLVHAHNYHTIVGQAALASGLPFVFTPHYHGTGHSWLAVMLHKLYRQAGKRLFAGADAIICVSKAEYVLVRGAFPGTAAKMSIIHNGFDRLPLNLSEFSRAAPDSKVVLTVGRLDRYKNINLIIKAFHAMSVPARLVIVGEGPERGRLEQLAYDGMSAGGWPVIFTGRLSDESLNRLMCTADVVTSASDHEAFGIVLAEGLAAGAQVVASGIPAYREVGALAGDTTSITFAEPGNTYEFAAALEAALRKGRIDPGQVRLPTWSDVAEATRTVYVKVLAGTAPVPGGSICERTHG